MITKEYHAEPTAVKFHQSTADVKYVEACVGSGKSTMCIMEILKLAMAQQPDDCNIRYSRWAIIRGTNPQLRSTTIKTFEMWVPPSVAPVVYSAPINAKMKQVLSDGTVLDVEFIFLALDQTADIEKLTSLELTGAYLNEGREIEFVHMETLKGRIDRFPQTKKDAQGNTLYGPTSPVILIDSNPPMTTHWLYTLFSTGEVPEGYEKFTQPPAVFKDEEGAWQLNPDAENLSHLPDKYYANQLKGASDEYIKVMLAGEPGMTAQGKPVYGTYSSHKHLAKEILQPMRGLPVIIGFDFGLQPAAIFMQLSYKGLRVLDECPASDESLEDFITEYVKPIVMRRYPGYPLIGVGDPAGRGRSSLDKRTPFDVLMSAGLKAFPALTNNPITRKETVEWFMRRDEGFIISAHCTFTAEAFAGGYVYKKQRNTSGRYSDRPDKNEYSHIMDACQYGALWARYGYAPTRKATEAPATKYKWA